MRFRTVTLDDLRINDERSFRHVGLYEELKQALRSDGYRFRVPEGGGIISWDRAVFLNLTFWNAVEQGDVLTSDSIEADVVAHVAWHHLARKALGGAAGTADALFFSEAIASAFDLYLVGRLLGHAPDALFLETQVPAMSEAADAAGLSEAGFEALLASIAEEPERAFEDLRQLLFDVTTTLVASEGAAAAAIALERFEAHRFAPLLHHYELSNWILYARAHGLRPVEPEPSVRALDQSLRSADVALDFLERAWLT